MFVAGFPLATVMSLVSNYVGKYEIPFVVNCLSFLLSNITLEIRVDAWKLCQLSRRPEPRGIEDIGTWYDSCLIDIHVGCMCNHVVFHRYSILEITAMAAVFINSGIVAITAGNTINYTWVERTWIFIMMATGLFW